MGRLLIVGLATGEPSEWDGQYVVEYDPSRPHQDPESLCSCHLVTTTDPDDALQAGSTALWRLYMQDDQREMYRPDGKPNRPLTAFTVEFIQ